MCPRLCSHHCHSDEDKEVATPSEVDRLSAETTVLVSIEHWEWSLPMLDLSKMNRPFQVKARLAKTSKWLCNILYSSISLNFCV